MNLPRRTFLGLGAAAGTMALTSHASAADANASKSTTEVSTEALNQAADRPVLKKDAFKDPVVIQSVELLKKGRDYFVRVRSKDGAEGISVDNGRMDVLHPILSRLVAP